MSENSPYQRVVTALNGATSRTDYLRAKELAEACTLAEQCELINRFIEVHQRLGLNKGR